MQLSAHKLAKLIAVLIILKMVDVICLHFVFMCQT